MLTLNRPERLNAWTDALEDRYFDLLDTAEADPDVRAVVVTGAGRGFCAGADMRISSLLRGSTLLCCRPDRRRPKRYRSVPQGCQAAPRRLAFVLDGSVDGAPCDSLLRRPVPVVVVRAGRMLRGSGSGLQLSLELRCVRWRPFSDSGRALPASMVTGQGVAVRSTRSSNVDGQVPDDSDPPRRPTRSLGTRPPRLNVGEQPVREMPCLRSAFLR